MFIANQSPKSNSPSPLESRQGQRLPSIVLLTKEGVCLVSLAARRTPPVRLRGSVRSGCGERRDRVGWRPANHAQKVRYEWPRPRS